MRLSQLKNLIITFSSLWLIGCSMDQTAVIDHPSSAKPNAEFNVIFADLFTIISDGPELTMNAIKADSLHAALGLPTGWSVQSISYYTVPKFDIGKYGNTEDPEFIAKFLKDSLTVYKQRASNMSVDTKGKAFFTNKTFTADGSNGDTSTTIDSDSIGQWHVYGSRINLNFPVGTKMDTVYAFDSLQDTSGTMGGFDSIGMKVVPIIIWATLKTNNKNGNVNLYYFTKTSPLITDSTLDDGNLIYYPFTVDPNSSVFNFSHSQKRGAQIAAWPNPWDRRTSLQINIPSKSAFNLGIYSMDGQLVKEIRSQNNRTISWDGNGKTGRVKPGNYVIKINGSSQVVAPVMLKIVK